MLKTDTVHFPPPKKYYQLMVVESQSTEHTDKAGWLSLEIPCN